MNPGSNYRWLLISQQEKELGIYVSRLEAFNTIHETILKKILSLTLIKPQIYYQFTGNTRVGEADYPTTQGYGHKNSRVQQTLLRVHSTTRASKASKVSSVKNHKGPHQL